MFYRILWFICTFASLAAAIACISIILIKFTTAPMLTAVYLQIADENMPFPVILACPSSEYLNLPNYTEVINTKYRATRTFVISFGDELLNWFVIWYCTIQDEKRTLVQLYDWNWNEVQIANSFKITPNLRYLFETSIPACKDMIADCKYTCVDKYEHILLYEHITYWKITICFINNDRKQRQ